MLCKAMCGNIFDDFSSMDKRPPPVLDLEKLIEDHVWDLLEIPHRCSCACKCCDKKKLTLRVDWSVIERKDEVLKFHLLPDVIEAPKSVQLFKTKFENNSGNFQQFSFKTQRTTQSNMEISVQQGLSIGGKLEMSFPLIKPEVPSGCPIEAEELKLTSGLIGGSVNWNITAGEKMSKSETLQWGVDTNVGLKNGQTAVATLAVREANLVGLLTMKTIIKLTSETKLLPVDVIRRDNNEIVSTVDVRCGDLVEMCSKLTPIENDGMIDSFYFIGTLSCRATYAIDQSASVILTEDIYAAKKRNTGDCQSMLTEHQEQNLIETC